MEKKAAKTTLSLVNVKMMWAIYTKIYSATKEKTERWWRRCKSRPRTWMSSLRLFLRWSIYCRFNHTTYQHWNSRREGVTRTWQAHTCFLTSAKRRTPYFWTIFTFPFIVSQCFCFFYLWYYFIDRVISCFSIIFFNNII